ncbi:hypothetical protein FDECE_6108 [Fusarium decemcellulare]|nr:hypothetical protein FDECE_6108 [Fusarium decemcellulare]
MNALVNSLAVVGGAVVLYAAYSIFDFVSLHFIKPSRPLQSYLRAGPDPTYALITGASAGIGFGVAQELVKHGFGVILLGHLEDELHEAKKSIEKDTPGASVRIVVMDAVKATAEDITGLVKSLEHLNITILDNNIGGNPIAPVMREFATYSTAEVDIVIEMNARFMARLTALMMPILSRKPEEPGKRSLILNMSSGGSMGLPWVAMYSATKAFNLGLSRSLAREFDCSPGSHIDSLAIIPGDVRSHGNSEGVLANAPTWDQYGRHIVSTVDGAIRRKKRELVPFWRHDLEQKILLWLSEDMRTKEIGKVVAYKKHHWEVHHAKNR